MSKGLSKGFVMLDGVFDKTAELLTKAWGYSTVIGWYNERSAPNELNVLVRFADAASVAFKEATAFYEVMIDGGRIDLLIVSPDVILVAEGKTTFHSAAKSLITSLNSQIDRIHGENGGIRALMDEKILSYCKERWGLQSLPPIYVVALSWCNAGGLSLWGSHEHWSSSLSRFVSGSKIFKFNGDDHYFLFKYQRSNGIAWV